MSKSRRAGDRSTPDSRKCAPSACGLGRHPGAPRRVAMRGRRGFGEPFGGRAPAWSNTIPFTPSWTNVPEASKARHHRNGPGGHRFEAAPPRRSRRVPRGSDSRRCRSAVGGRQTRLGELGIEAQVLARRERRLHLPVDLGGKRRDPPPRLTSTGPQSIRRQGGRRRLEARTRRGAAAAGPSPFSRMDAADIADRDRAGRVWPRRRRRGRPVDRIRKHPGRRRQRRDSLRGRARPPRSLVATSRSHAPVEADLALGHAARARRRPVRPGAAASGR